MRIVLENDRFCISHFAYILVAVIVVFVSQTPELTYSADKNPTSFQTTILPRLTKLSCNSGACHGAAAGRGEFFLSLYGSRPASDYEQTVHALEGRRIDFAVPEESLFLLKPTETITHGGGTVIDLDSDDYHAFLSWIKQGAPFGKQTAIKQLHVTPAEPYLADIQEDIPLRAFVEYVDGTRADVTHLTSLQANDVAAVSIDHKTSTARMLRPGQHLIIARYINLTQPITLLSPYDNELAESNDPVTESFIDHDIVEKLKRLRIPLSPQIDDVSFLRRLRLDLTGRLPTPEEIHEFLGDESLLKRERLRERLLASQDYVDYWTYEFAKLLRIRSQPQDQIGARIYANWLKAQIENDTSYAQIADELIRATGDTHELGPPNFYRMTGGPREQAEFVSELFLGSRLRCANCHDHPLDRWTQNDYHGLAAIFAGVKTTRTITFNSTATVVHPATGEVAIPQIPGADRLEQPGDHRQAFVNWMVSQDNPYFAKAIVNRVWKQLMGRGLIEPVDDFRATNPATHPELLNRLSQYFIEQNYQLKPLIRMIVSSNAYARSSQAIKGNETDSSFYSRAIVKPLSPEVLADAIVEATGIPLDLPQEKENLRAVQLSDGRISSSELERLGRCSREESCENATSVSAGLALQLHLLNGDLLNKRIESDKGRLDELIRNNNSTDRIVEELYLVTVSRKPSAEEMCFWSNELSSVSSQEQRRKILQDLFWALLMSEQFQTNH